jgi:hypothetical protein
MPTAIAIDAQRPTNKKQGDYAKRYGFARGAATGE